MITEGGDATRLAVPMDTIVPVPTIVTATTIIIPAAPELVWDLVVDPQRMGDVDSRVSLVSMSGPPGTPGSSYVLDLQVSAAGRTRVTYEVIDGGRPTHITIAGHSGQRHLGEQRGTFHAVDAGCRMDWQVSAPSPLLLFPLTRRLMKRRLQSWAVAVSAQAQRGS
jgi:carbon monoxide dehydrogenase subunit G